MLNFRNLFESIWNSNAKVIEENRKRKRRKEEKKLEKGHGATIRPKTKTGPWSSSFSPELVPFLPLPP
jgi:hypothetical protein